ncbi:MAG: nucleotidyltransferase domain-containing protein [Sarcina sp.]
MREKLLTILSSVVNGSKLEGFENLGDREWNNIYDEASAHSLESVVYYAIKESDIEITSEKFEEWKRSVFLSNIHQNKHISVVSVALEKLHSAGIPVMVLKGLVLRELYPKSELRSMSDADILVRVEDLDLTCDILEGLGYTKPEVITGNESHIVFDNETTRIEVHWDLVNENFFSGKNNFDINIWEDANNLSIEGASCFALGNEDLILHMLTHMMVHLYSMGFSLRQVLDLAFVISKNRETIDWDLVIKKIEDAQILKFALYVFEVCEMIFGIELPGDIKMLVLTNKLDSKYTNLFIEDIFSSGVFGTGERNESFGKNFAYDKKTKILLPFAWTQHILGAMFNRNYCFSEKKKIFSTVKIAKKRKKLLEYLEVSRC